MDLDDTLEEMLDNNEDAFEKNEDISTFDDMYFNEIFKRGNSTHRKEQNGVKIIEQPLYNKLTRAVIKNNGIIIRGTDEAEEYLKNRDATAVTIGDVIIFSKNVSVSDVLEETFHFFQNLQKKYYDKDNLERELLVEIEAKEYLLSVKEKYRIPEEETELTLKQLSSYKKMLEVYYENN